MPIDAVLYANLKRAELNTLEYGHDLAVAMSSGPFKLKVLRRKGFSYSRLSPNPPLPPSIINVQSGAFKRAWRIEMTYDPIAGGVAGQLVNETFEADMLEAGGSGKSRMIARPISKVLERKMEPVREANLTVAILKTLEKLNENS